MEENEKKIARLYIAPEIVVSDVAIEHNFLQASGTGQVNSLDFTGEYW